MGMMGRTLTAMNALLIWGKCMKYISFFPYVKTLVTTLEGCWTTSLSFMVMFSTNFMAFCVAYAVGFGETIQELSSLGSAAIYLCRLFVGDVDLTPVYEEAPAFGAILIMLYVLGVYFLMLYLFFAILATAFQDANTRKVQDFKEEMLIESVAKVKESLANLVDVESKVRRVAPGLWARIYEKSRMREKKQKEKEREEQERAEEARNEAKAAKHTAKHRLNGGKRPLPIGDKKDPATRTILGNVENMAGRVLSKIQGIQFEITAEMGETQEAIKNLNLAGGVLIRRLQDLHSNQMKLRDY